MKLNGLLDGYGTTDSVKGTGKDKHQSIAEALHLNAARGCSSLPQELEMGPADCLGSIVTQTLEQLRRPDEVGE